MFNFNNNFTWNLTIVVKNLTTYTLNYASFALVGCRQPCFNGGRCITGACACPNNYEGPQCRIPVGFDIRIIIPDNLTPMVGDDLSFTCEVGSGGQYRNPLWRDTRGNHIPPLQEGQSSGVIYLHVNSCLIQILTFLCFSQTIWKSLMYSNFVWWQVKIEVKYFVNIYLFLKGKQANIFGMNLN